MPIAQRETLPNMKMGVGVVEDIKDPTGNHRMKVRVFQIHPTPAKLPTEKLPWASVTVPVNSSQSFGMPYVGDWVLCTFLDGNNGQEIIVLGVIPGINSEDGKAPTDSTETISSLKDELIAAEAKLETMKNNSGSGSASQEQIDAQTALVSSAGAAVTAAQAKYDELVERRNNTLLYNNEGLNNAISAAGTELAEAQKQLTAGMASLTAMKNKKTYTPADIDAQQKIVDELRTRIARLELEEEARSNSYGRDNRPQSEINKDPRPTLLGSHRRAGYPSTVTLSRTKKATGVEFADLDKLFDHICGEDSYIRRGIAQAKVMAGQVGAAIRKALEAILQALGSIPGVQAVLEALKWLVEKIKMVIEWLDEINKGILEFIRQVKLIKALIEWILSLPAKLLALFRDCLAKAYAELARAAFDILKAALPGGGDYGAVGQIIVEYQNLKKETDKLAKTVNTTVSLANEAITAFSSPSTMSEADKNKYGAMLTTEEGRSQLVKEIYPDSSQHDKTQYKKVM